MLYVWYWMQWQEDWDGGQIVTEVRPNPMPVTSFSRPNDSCFMVPRFTWEWE